MRLVSPMASRAVRLIVKRPWRNRGAGIQLRVTAAARARSRQRAEVPHIRGDARLRVALTDAHVPVRVVARSDPDIDPRADETDAENRDRRPPVGGRRPGSRCRGRSDDGGGVRDGGIRPGEVRRRDEDAERVPDVVADAVRAAGRAGDLETTGAGGVTALPLVRGGADAARRRAAAVGRGHPDADWRDRRPGPPRAGGRKRGLTES